MQCQADGLKISVIDNRNVLTRLINHLLDIVRLVLHLCQHTSDLLWVELLLLLSKCAKNRLLKLITQVKLLLNVR